MSTVPQDLTTALPSAGTWTFDPSHSSVEVVARHLVVSKVRGRFAAFSGTVEIAEDVARSRVSVEIDASSLGTHDAKRDAHLASGEFLDVAAHPTIAFLSTGAVHVAGDRWRIPGQLTIRGVTRDAELDATYHGVHEDPWGATHAAFSASTTIDREAFGMSWNQALEAGGVLVSRMLEVELDVQLLRA